MSGLLSRKSSWTLLVERLSSSTHQEEWSEVIQQVDKSDTYKTEEAKRKYAICKNVPFQSVELEEVENSPQGLAGWAEMCISVPGIEETSSEAGSNAGTPVRSGKTPSSPAPKKKGGKRTAAEAVGAAPCDEEDNKARKPKKTTSLEVKANKEAEKLSKELICMLVRSQQAMGKVSGEIDRFPSEWTWAKVFLSDYVKLQERFKDSLAPSGGESLAEFVDQLKLSIISPNGLKLIKKNYKDNYYIMLTRFNDRCHTVCEETLGIHNPLTL